MDDAADAPDSNESPEGASTLAEVLEIAERQGHGGEFVPSIDDDGGLLTCPHCGEPSRPESVARLWLTRLEGVSDPDDMLSVSALRCPHCDGTGVLVSRYGPGAGEEDAAVIGRLPQPGAPDSAPDR